MTNVKELRIGEFLFSISAIHQWQIDVILEIQNRGDKRSFGEIAIEKGYINDATLRAYLEYRAPPMRLMSDIINNM